MIKSIFTESAPKPSGHYTHAVTYQGIAYVSGQLPINPRSGEIVQGDVEQVAQVFENLEAVLEAARSDWKHVLNMTIFLTKRDLWSVVNTHCEQLFGEHFPARTIVPEVGLKQGVCIEVTLVAAQKEAF